MNHPPTLRKPTEGRTFAVVGATTALPPSREEIEKLLKIAPKYGIEILVPH